MKCHWLLAALAMLLVAGPAFAGVAPSVCTELDTAGLSKARSFSWKVKDQKPRVGDGQMLVADKSRLATVLRSIQGDSLEFQFDLPKLKYPYGSLDIYGFTLIFVVSEDGHVTCASIKPAYKASGPAINYNRAIFLQGVSDWRFKPYLIDGKPAKIVVELPVDEEELPRVHVPMPAGDPAEVTITQDMRPEMASFGPYRVELHGDGTAIYTSGYSDDPLGPQTYHVDAKAVQGLVDKARAMDFWSLRDQYRSPNIYDNGRPEVDRVNITLGGKTKSSNAGNNESGMPSAVRAFHMNVLDVARIDFWQRPTLATLDQLKANDFDFTSRASGKFLLQMAQNPGVKDDAVLALMQLGAPQDGYGPSRYVDDSYSVLDAALNNNRIEVAKQLIANDALIYKGKPDQYTVDEAFSNAVESGKLAPVELMLPYHPSLTYEAYDSDDKNAQVSIILKLGANCGRFNDPIPVAQRLLDLGADVNASEADGQTLLHRCKSNVDFTRFLLDHGADIEAVDEDGRTPLGSTYDEDVALLLLSRGANPRQESASQNLRFNVKENEWRWVKAWLESHGFADVLKPVPGEGNTKQVEVPHT